MRILRPLAIATLVLACGSTSPSGRSGTKIGRTQSTHESAPITLPAAFTGQEPALHQAAILGMLPDATMAAIVAKSPRELSSATDAEAILREYGAFFANANLSLSADKQSTLLVPDSWSHLGIDPDGPIGAALHVEERAVGLFFVSLNDVERFRAQLPDVALAVRLGATREASVGDRHIFRFQEESVAVLVHAKTAVLIAADRRSDLEPTLNKLIGSSDSPTLGHTGRLAKAFSGFDYGEDVAGFVAFDSIAARIADDRVRRADDDWYTRQLEEAEKKVEDAKAAGMDQGAIDELEAELTSLLEDYNRHSLRESAEAQFTDNILGALGSVSFGVDLDGLATGMRIRIQATPDSVADRLLIPGAGPLELPRRLQESPLSLLAGHLDKQAATELFTTLLNMEGETIGSLARNLQQEVGVELARLLSVVGGELSGALTVNRDLLAKAEGPEAMQEAFGVHFLVEVRDPEGARRLFQQALASPQLRRFRSGSGETAVLDVPSFNKRPIRISLQDRFFEARSLGPAEAGQVWRAHEQDAIGSANSLALGVFDPMVIQWLFLSLSSYEDHYFESVYQDRPGSASDAKRQERLTALRKEIAELERRRSMLRNEGFLKGSAALGRMTAVAQREPAGSLALFGSIAGSAANIGRGMQTMIESMDEELEFQRTGKKSDAQIIEEELSKLRAESWELRESMY